MAGQCKSTRICSHNFLRRAELTAMGWHVELTESQVGVYRFFKNGKMRKTPDVYMLFQEFTTDYFDQGSNGELVEPKRPSSRPWYVRSNASGEKGAEHNPHLARHPYIYASMVEPRSIYLPFEFRRHKIAQNRLIFLSGFNDFRHLAFWLGSKHVGTRICILLLTDKH